MSSVSQSTQADKTQPHDDDDDDDTFIKVSRL